MGPLLAAHALLHSALFFTLQTPAAEPLPDIPTMMYRVEQHQKATESIEHDYLYHSLAILRGFDGKGSLKKTETEESDIFFVAGTRIRRITSRNGKDLTPDEQHKEQEHINKEIAKAKASPSQREDRDVVTVSRFLELGTFSNARRLTLDDRPTIAVDFTGNPKAPTRSRFEGAIREMAGTLWVDEQDLALRKIEGRFLNDWKLGGGLVADIKHGSTFRAEWTKVNNEVWLPITAAGEGSMRALLFLNIHGSLQVTNSAYRKFRATSTIIPVAPSQPPPTP